MADTTKTRVQLLAQVANFLGLTQPGEALSSEDADTIDALVDPVIAMLNADRVIYVDDADAVPVNIFIPVCSIVANYCGPSFGASINRDALREDYGTLRRITSADPQYTTFAGTYF